MSRNIVNFLKDEEGATAIEYGLIAALVAVGLVVALGALGNELFEVFGNIVKELGGEKPQKPA